MVRDDVAQELQRLGTEIKHILHIQPAAADSSVVALTKIHPSE
jgi:hypothetical protein